MLTETVVIGIGKLVTAIACLAFDCLYYRHLNMLMTHTLLSISSNLVNTGAICLFGILWGLTIPLSKIAVSTGHHQFGLIFWQMAITALVLGAFVFIMKIKVPLDRKHLIFYLIIAFIGTLLPNSFSYMALREIPAGIASVVIATVPIMSLVIALIAKIERFEPLRMIGIGCGVSALILLAAPDVNLNGSIAWQWVAIALIAPICYGIEGNFVAVKSPVELSAVPTLFGASVIGTMIIGPIAWFGGYWVTMGQEWQAPEWAILGSALGHLLAYAGYLWLVKRAGAVFTSQIAYVVTLTGVFVSMIALGENYGWMMWVSVALMLVGVTLVRPRET